MTAIVFAGIFGLIAGIVTTQSQKGGGLELALIAALSFLFAGVAGAITAFVPAAAAVWTTRVVVFLVLYFVGICLEVRRIARLAKDTSDEHNRKK